MATKPEGDFSRQGAGIGTRGPGETKLETNKRAARNKIYRLQQELNEIAKHRELTRKKREINDIFTVALVGYTNAGKSTLFNRLTKSNVYADNKLFATLDTTIRKLALPNNIEILLCDTVGFINDLPHTLLNAFKSTLEEAV
ncbi:MAG: 50S ribosome-binding GTPase, partial [Clostridia bacterium]|nr:50S ribosome-binding GTPase [Clostridia bacterium]